MIMARLLPKEDFATYRQTLLVFLSVSPFLQLGIGPGIYYFLSKETQRVRGRVMDAIVALGSMGFVFGLFIALGGGEYLAQKFSNPQLASLLLWMVPLALIAVPASQVSPVLVVRERVYLSSFFGVSSQLIIGICSVAPLLIWQNSQAPLVGYVISGIIMGTIAVSMMLYVTPSDFSRPSLSGIKQLVFFSFPIGVSTMIGTISMQLGNWLVSVNFDPETFAIFSVGARELPFVGIVTGSITAVLMAEMVKSFSDEEPLKALDLWKLAATKASLILFPLTAFLIVFADGFVVILFSDKYASSTGVFQVFLGMLPLRIFSFGSILVSAGASRFILWRTMVWAISSLCLSVYFMNLWGIIGVAWAILLTQYLIAAPLNFWKIRKLTDCRYRELIPWKQLGLILSISLLPLLAAYPSRSFLPLTLSFLAGGLVYGIFLLVSYELTGQIHFKKTFETIQKRFLPIKGQ